MLPCVIQLLKQACIHGLHHHSKNWKKLQVREKEHSDYNYNKAFYYVLSVSISNFLQVVISHSLWCQNFNVKTALLCLLLIGHFK